MTSVTAMPGPPPHLSSVPASSHASTDKTKYRTDNIPRGPTRATLNFFASPADGSVPYNYVEQPPEGEPQRNFGDDYQEVQISDLRGKESSFQLDSHAFSVLQNHPHNESIDWNNDESIRTHYYPEVEQILLHNIPGSPKRIILFDHTIRRAEPNAHRAPVNRAHIDQTPKSSKMRVELHLTEGDAKRVLADGTRYRIINVWRPLNGAVETHPLAFADSSTVTGDDIVGVEHRYPQRTGETAGVKYNPAHKWWYWSGIDNSERILLQCFDSENPMNRVPHTAFVDQRSTEASKPRESIEVRALILG